METTPMQSRAIGFAEWMTLTVRIILSFSNQQLLQLAAEAAAANTEAITSVADCFVQGRGS
jgi:hypothetical protein